jgi:hypothetical protein
MALIECNGVRRQLGCTPAYRLDGFPLTEFSHTLGHHLLASVFSYDVSTFLISPYSLICQIAERALGFRCHRLAIGVTSILLD